LVVERILLKFYGGEPLWLEGMDKGELFVVRTGRSLADLLLTSGLALQSLLLFLSGFYCCRGGTSGLSFNSIDYIYFIIIELLNYLIIYILFFYLLFNIIIIIDIFYYYYYYYFYYYYYYYYYFKI